MMGATQKEDPKQKNGGPKTRSIFQMANKELEDSEGDRESPSPEDNVPSRCSELQTSEEAMPPNSQTRADEISAGTLDIERPPGPSAAEVTMASKDLKRCMEEFGVDLATVTQAFLKNSGEVVAAECCLRTGQRLDSCPLWERQDDINLQAGDESFRVKLVMKYGAENVHKRIVFRNS